MKLEEVYKLAIRLGMEADPREKEVVEKVLTEAKEEFEELEEEKKEFFDQARLENPYSDTRILTGDLNKDVARVLVGIDIDTGEILLADRLKEKGKEIDAVISHHPSGKALAALYDVMHMQEDILHELGVPINVAESIMSKRIDKVKRGLMPINHNKSRDAAKLFDLPLMTAHTPSDNLVVDFLQNKVDDSDELDTVGDIIEFLKDIPEYKEATKLNAGPSVVVGSEKRSAGKIVVEMTGGTSGSKEAFEHLVQAGVGTLICMHIKEEHRKKAEENHINVIIAGHMASDSIGMNLFADELEKQGIEIVPCSGFIRYSRL